MDHSKSDTRLKPWKLLSTKLVLDNPWMTVHQHAVELPKGMIEPNYPMWHNRDVVIAAALDPAGRLVMVRQYRHAADRVMLQYSAGMVDAGEEPEAAARRELEEETGYVAEAPLVHLGSYWPNPVKATGRNHIYFTPLATPTGTTHWDDKEEIEVVLTSLDDVMEQLSTPGEFTADVLATTMLLTRQLAAKLTEAPFKGRSQYHKI